MPINQETGEWFTDFPYTNSGDLDQFGRRSSALEIDLDPDQYVGLSLPLGHSSGGFFMRTKRLIHQAGYNLTNLIKTIPGERAGNPNFGSHVTRLLFEPVDNISNLIEEEIRRVVDLYLSYIIINNVKSHVEPPHTVRLEVNYSIRNDLTTSEDVNIDFLNISSPEDLDFEGESTWIDTGSS